MAAKRTHGTLPEQRAAVLGAWANLAGVAGWTPEMVRAVEQELRK